MSDKNHNFGSLVCIYAQLLPRVREAAKNLGYAIAIHGSMQRDLDLLAIPWIEDAAEAEALVAEVAKAVDGFVIGNEDRNFDRGVVDCNPTKQPHGRKSWNICWGGRPFIDLSVMPRVSAWRRSTAPSDARPTCMSVSFNFITQRLATGGRIESAADVEALHEAGITDIINLDDATDDAPLLSGYPLMRYLHNPTADDGQPKPASWFKTSLDYAMPLLANPGRTKLYVHCHDGIDRGPVTAYTILRAWGFSHEHALLLIRLARPVSLFRYVGDADAAVKQLGYV